MERHLRRTELFGKSIFELDADAPTLPRDRVVDFLRLAGIDGLEPVSLAELNISMDSLTTLPVWPAAGSVRRMNGAIVVNFSSVDPRLLAAALGSQGGLRVPR